MASMPPAMPPTTGPHLVTASDEEEDASSEGDALEVELEVVLGFEGDVVRVPEDWGNDRESVVLATIGATVSVGDADACAE
jgi:hypothetical protein